MYTFDHDALIILSIVYIAIREDDILSVSYTMRMTSNASIYFMHYSKESLDELHVLKLYVTHRVSNHV